MNDTTDRTTPPVEIKQQTAPVSPKCSRAFHHAVQLDHVEEKMAEHYRSLLAAGLAFDLVCDQMKQDGVAHNRAVLKGVVYGNLAYFVNDKLVAPYFDKHRPIAHPLAQTNSEQEAKVSHYRSLLVAGLPVEAVRHQMEIDGADSAELNQAVFYGNTESKCFPDCRAEKWE